MYIGNEDKIDWVAADAGTYYIILDTGEVYTEQDDISNYYNEAWAREELIAELGSEEALDELEDDDPHEYEERIDELIGNALADLEFKQKRLEEFYIYAYIDYYNPNAIQCEIIRNAQETNPGTFQISKQSWYSLDDATADQKKMVISISRDRPDMPVIAFDIYGNEDYAYMDGEEIPLNDALDILYN